MGNGKAFHLPSPISHLPSPISHLPFPISHFPFPISHFVSALALTGALASCAREPAAPPKPTNLLIVTIDTLRADRLGIYGAANVSTPHIDRLAHEGAWAPQAVVHAPLTRPSHASLFTGRYPAEHGIRDNISPPLPANEPVLAALFEQEKFATAAFVSSVVLDRQSGLARGFSLYGDRMERDGDRRTGDLVVADAIAWLKGLEEKTPFFAWVHLYDPHAPYEPPSPFKEQYAGRPYDGTVAWSDELVGRLIAALRETNTLDRTLVVVTSDHGEALGEHGEDVHGYFIYEATLRVPLVIRGPGVNAGTRLNGVVRTIDLYPTIVELFGFRPSPSLRPARREDTPSGKSLAAGLAGGRVHDEPSFAESLVPLLHYGWSDLRSVRDGRWKYILAPRPELYDLDRDPGELHNLIDAEPARARAMNAGIKERLQTEQKVVRAGPGRSGVPPELLEKLGALGYVSPGGPSNAKASGADPKDTLEDYKAITASMQQALTAFRSGRPAEAVAHLQPLVKRGFDSYELHYYLGRSYAALGRPRAAASSYERAAALFPGDATAWRSLGQTRVALRDWPRAARAFEKLVEVVPEDALARMELGQVYRDQGRWNEAAAAMRAAVDRDSSRADFWNALGTAYGGGGKMAEAERAFAEAAARDNGNAMFRYNHALALQQLGRRDEALAELRAAARLGSSEARALLGTR
jgi:choline-sulfatase